MSEFEWDLMQLEEAGVSFRLEHIRIDRGNWGTPPAHRVVVDRKPLRLFTGEEWEWLRSHEEDIIEYLRTRSGS
jgi:hypothetical protein